MFVTLCVIGKLALVQSTSGAILVQRTDTLVTKPYHSAHLSPSVRERFDAALSTLSYFTPSPS